MRKLAILAVLLTLTCCAGSNPDVKTVLNNATQAMGAANVKTIEFSGSGFQFAHGQPIVPFSDLPRYNAKSFNYQADYVTPGSRQEMVRTQTGPPRGGGAQPLVGEAKTLEYLSGNYAWTVNESTGQANRQPGDQGGDKDIIDVRQVFLWVTPHGFLHAA